jgi:energy-coupling factor transport system permease protein
MSDAAPRRLAARAHPFTPLVLVLAVVLLAFLLPAPAGPLALAALTVVLAPVVRDAGALRPAAVIVVPLWILLFVVQALLGDAPRIALGPVAVSATGLRETIAQGARLTAIVIASLVVVRGFRASRFVDAALARGWPFAAAYLVAATIAMIPRLRQRVAVIRDAQRARGLRLGGSLRARLAGLGPLALPLVFGALADADDRALALESRGVVAASRKPGRTPLHPPPDTTLDRALRLVAIAAVVAALAWRMAR